MRKQLHSHAGGAAPEGGGSTAEHLRQVELGSHETLEEGGPFACR